MRRCVRFLWHAGLDGESLPTLAAHNCAHGTAHALLSNPYITHPTLPHRVSQERNRSDYAWYKMKRLQKSKDDQKQQFKQVRTERILSLCEYMSRLFCRTVQPRARILYPHHARPRIQPPRVQHPQPRRSRISPRRAAPLHCRATSLVTS